MVCVVSPYEKDIAPSERFRIVSYLPYFINLGEVVRFYPFLGVRETKYLNSASPFFPTLCISIKNTFYRIIQLLRINGGHFILLHREAIPFGPPIFEWFLFKVLRKKVIYDFDDAIWLPDVNQESRIKAFLKCRWKYRYLIKNSDTVIAGNSYLLEYAKKHNTKSILIPTVVDTDIHKPSSSKKESRQIVIGWTGSSSTMKYLEEVYEVIDGICKEYNAIFKIISDSKPDYPSDNFIFCQWNKETEIEDLSDIDIGIMPLTNDEWSKGKCGFKAIQFMAMQIPVLVSPVGANLDIVTHGEEGLYCNIKEEWKTNLELLINSRELRSKMGEKGRKKIVENYSIQSTRAVFLSLFE